MIYVLVIAMIAVVPMLLFFAIGDVVGWLLDALGAAADES